MPNIVFSRFVTPLVLVTAAAVGGAACATTRSASGPGILQPGAPGQETRTITEAQATDLSKVGATEADVKFMQGMIGHHAQAVEMVALLMTNSNNPDMKRLGLRIQVSQDDEMNMMRTWLKERGQEIPGPHAHHMPGGFMPGMLTAEEMATLGAAKGVEFDRLFLTGMIKHHGGAITMVDELFKSPGAGQEGGIYAFASDVVADQQMEIDRMGAMLKEIKK
ncbi:MAG: hypothetical protein RLZZ53_1946 [Acidobacteriota bacterium]